MRINIYHGRRTPDEELDDWGPSAPALEGVAYVHQTYGGEAEVCFVDEASAAHARAMTGWEFCGVNALRMRWHGEMLVCQSVYDVEPMYFGDWELDDERAELTDELLRFADGVRDMWDSGRLQPGDVPDDYQWLAVKLDEIERLRGPL